MTLESLSKLGWVFRNLLYYFIVFVDCGFFISTWVSLFQTLFLSSGYDRSLGVGCGGCSFFGPKLSIKSHFCSDTIFPPFFFS